MIIIFIIGIVGIVGAVICYGVLVKIIEHLIDVILNYVNMLLDICENNRIFN